MNTHRTLIILQYNIRNNKEDIMIFLLIDFNQLNEIRCLMSYKSNLFMIEDTDRQTV
jgi:hypothetical protein